MQTIDEFFAHPVNPLLSLFLRILRHHQFSEEDANAALIALNEQLRLPNSASDHIYMEWHETLSHLPWERFPRQAVVRPLLFPLSLHPPGKHLQTLGDLWPVTFSQMLIDAGFDVQPEKPSALRNCGDLDILATPHPSRAIDLSGVVAACGSAMHQGGVAFECKAVQSPKQVRTNIVRASKQLGHHGGGLSAVDVSSLIVQKLGDTPPETVADAERFIEDRGRTILGSIGNPFATRNPHARSTAATIVYCRALVAPKQLASTNNIFGYADISRYSYFVNRSYLSERQRSDCERGLEQFIRYLMRDVTTAVMAAPRDHRPWIIQPGQTIECGVGSDGQFKVMPQP